MKTGHAVYHPPDWMVLHQHRSDRPAVWYDLDADFRNLLKNTFLKIPAVPKEILDSPMPAGVPVVIPPVVQFLAGEVVRHNAADMDGRYCAAVSGVVAALGAAYDWIDRIIKVGYELIGELENWETEGIPLLPVIDSAEANPLLIRQVVRRSRNV